MENNTNIYQRLANPDFPNIEPARQFQVRQIAKKFSTEIISSRMNLRLDDKTFDSISDTEYKYLIHVMKTKYHIVLIPSKGFELSR